MTETTETQITTIPEHEIETNVPNWYRVWRERIQQWIGNNSDDLIADIVLFVPDMLMLTMRLIKDKRVPFLLKAQLILSVAYVISPFDFIPEGISGVIGLVDDAGVLALTLYWIRNIIGIDPQILKDNWVGDNDLNEVIQDVHQRVNDNANKLFDGEVWDSIRAKFARLEDSPQETPTENSSQMGKEKISIGIDFD